MLRCLRFLCCLYECIYIYFLHIHTYKLSTSSYPALNHSKRNHNSKKIPLRNFTVVSPEGSSIVAQDRWWPSSFSVAWTHSLTYTTTSLPSLPLPFLPVPPLHPPSSIFSLCTHLLGCPNLHPSSSSSGHTVITGT